MRFHIGADKSILLWNVSTGELLTQASVADSIDGIAFLPDNRIAVADRKRLTFLPWKPEDLVRAACQRVSRNLTEQEWQRYVTGEPYKKTCAALR